MYCLLLSIVLQTAPVWEITGAEFSKSEMHTADGISIRFPRMTRIRDDKDWKTATNLHQLRVRTPPPTPPHPLQTHTHRAVSGHGLRRALGLSTNSFSSILCQITQNVRIDCV